MFALLILLQVLPFWGPRGDGQRGNDLYAEEQYAEAAAAYQKGLDELDEPTGTVASGLWNNLGLTLFRQEAPAEALDAFRSAMTAAEDDDMFSRSAYNAGNTAFAADSAAQALALWREALLADPANEDARFNYEFVKRQQEQQQNQQDQQQNQQDQNEPPPEPSAYALMLKERADALVEQRQYRNAHRLLAAGRRTDPTVDAFKDYIGRLDDVASIDEGQAQLQMQQ